ncbi:MAG: hypothetical protein KC420_01195, partial [Myxococcales bacterium]|nr:hypothetical protein [Myxococcales bacterium]
QWSGYSGGQTFLLEHLKKLGQIRADHAATRRGTRKTLSVDADTMAYQMSGDGDTVYVLLNRSDSAKSVGGLPGGAFTDALSGAGVQGPSVMVPARGSMVLVAN